MKGTRGSDPRPAAASASDPRARKRGAAGTAWVLALTAICLMLGVVYLVGQGGQLDDLSDGDGLELIDDPDAPAPKGDEAEDDAPVVSAETMAPLPEILPRQSTQSAASDRESGLLRGQLLVAPKLRDTLRVWTLEVEEAINSGGRTQTGARRFRRRYELSPGTSIAHFELEDVPFSEYGWRVAAMAFDPYTASSSTVLPLDARRPEGDIRLSIKPATTVHITCKDQEHKMLDKVRVTLRPLGFPAQRKVHTMQTGVYGLAILEGVAPGDYEMVIGPLNRPLVPKKRIMVAGDKAHFEPIVVPKGGSLQLVITTTAGSGVHEVQVVAIAKQRRVYKKYETQSDKSGRAMLEHLPPGEYYLHLTKQGFRRHFQTISIEENKKIEKRETLHWDFRRRG